MTSPVVVDGRLSKEKLDELLALGAEHAELDFKATLDLTNPAHKLGLVKDLIAMSNSGSGGYIVVGADEHGLPAKDQAAVEEKQFDSADLGQLVARHVLTAPVVSAQAHEVDGRTIVLIHVAPPLIGLPCLISRSGEFADGKRMKVVLVEGVLYVRDGTRTVAATDGHWPRMLSRYRESVVAETRENIDALIAKVVDGLGEATGGVRLVPLAFEMNDAAFVEAVQPYFDNTESQNKLRRFLRSLRPQAGIHNSDGSSQSAALDKLCIVAIQAVLAESRDGFDLTMKVIYELYMESVGSFVSDDADQAQAQYWLDVLLRVMLIGATAVDDAAWWAVEPLINRGVSDYYLIWLRHALVHASRAGLLSGGRREASMVLVRARALALENPHLAPGLEARESAEEGGALPQDDALLNALCRFDFLWCTVAVATHRDRHDSALFYPSCAALKQERTSLMIDLLVKSNSVRDALLPDADVDTWREALKRVFTVAETQSHQYGTWWSAWGFDNYVEEFLTAES